jgi:hypothetical protein
MIKPAEILQVEQGAAKMPQDGGVPLLTENSSHKDVLGWLGGFLPQAELDKVPTLSDQLRRLLSAGLPFQGVQKFYGQCAVMGEGRLLA